jgi:putative effector of murein hydrolase
VLKKFSIESMVLSLICLLDLFSTIFLVSYRGYMEGNPLMSYYLDHGVVAFCIAKLILFIPPIFIIEYARRHRPVFAKIALRTCIGLYLFAYVSTFIQVNGLGRNSSDRIEIARSAVSGSMGLSK